MSKNNDWQDAYVVINNLIKVDHGHILGNPFKKEIVLTQVGQWMIQHKELLIGSQTGRGSYSSGKINKILAQHPQQGASPEDCFNFGLFYFMRSPERAFKKNYFDKGNTYSIKDYVLSNLKYMVTAYLKTLESGTLTIVPLLDGGEEDSTKGSPYGYVEDRVSDTSEDDLSDQAIYLDADLRQFDDEYWEMVNNLQKFLDLGKYKGNIKAQNLMNSLFFELDTANLNSHFVKVAERLGVSNLVLSQLMKDMKTGYRAKTSEIKDLFSGVQELTEAQKHGWKLPKYQDQ